MKSATENFKNNNITVTLDVRDKITDLLLARVHKRELRERDMKSKQSH